MKLSDILFLSAFLVSFDSLAVKSPAASDEDDFQEINTKQKGMAFNTFNPNPSPIEPSIPPINGWDYWNFEPLESIPINILSDDDAEKPKLPICENVLSWSVSETKIINVDDETENIAKYYYKGPIEQTNLNLIAHIASAKPKQSFPTREPSITKKVKKTMRKKPIEKKPVRWIVGESSHSKKSWRNPVPNSLDAIVRNLGFRIGNRRDETKIATFILESIRWEGKGTTLTIAESLGVEFEAINEILNGSQSLIIMPLIVKRIKSSLKNTTSPFYKMAITAFRRD
jgi:hypothetical protein